MQIGEHRGGEKIKRIGKQGKNVLACNPGQVDRSTIFCADEVNSASAVPLLATFPVSIKATTRFFDGCLRIRRGRSQPSRHIGVEESTPCCTPWVEAVHGKLVASVALAMAAVACTKTGAELMMNAWRSVVGRFGRRRYGGRVSWRRCRGSWELPAFVAVPAPVGAFCTALGRPCRNPSSPCFPRLGP